MKHPTFSRPILSICILSLACLAALAGGTPAASAQSPAAAGSDAASAWSELRAADLAKVEKLHAAHVTINVGRGSRVRVEHAQEVHAQNVQVPRKSKVKKAAHPDSIAAHLDMSGYVKYLIRRYQKYQHGDKEKVGRGKYVIIYNAIRGEFGRSWEDMAQADFESLVGFLHARIRNAKLGRILGAQGNKLFSSYSEWQKKPEKE